MKKIVLVGALIAATLAPMAAQAQDQRRWDNDRNHREWREDGRSWGNARQNDRREEWQRWRDTHRNDYRRGTWHAPFRYRTFAIGAVMPRDYWSSRYYVNNWSAYRLPNPGNRHYRYVRHYDDVLLIDIRNGRVVRVYRNFYW